MNTQLRNLALITLVLSILVGGYYTNLQFRDKNKQPTKIDTIYKTINTTQHKFRVDSSTISFCLDTQYRAISETSDLMIVLDTCNYNKIIHYEIIPTHSKLKPLDPYNRKDRKKLLDSIDKLPWPKIKPKILPAKWYSNADISGYRYLIDDITWKSHPLGTVSDTISWYYDTLTGTMKKLKHPTIFVTPDCRWVVTAKTEYEEFGITHRPCRSLDTFLKYYDHMKSPDTIYYPIIMNVAWDGHTLPDFQKYPDAKIGAEAFSQSGYMRTYFTKTHFVKEYLDDKKIRLGPWLIIWGVMGRKEQH